MGRFTGEGTGWHPAARSAPNEARGPWRAPWSRYPFRCRRRAEALFRGQDRAGLWCGIDRRRDGSARIGLVWTSSRVLKRYKKDSGSAAWPKLWQETEACPWCALRLPGARRRFRFTAPM